MNLITTVHIFYRSDYPPAVFWAGMIKGWIKKKHPKLKITASNPQLVIVLGGDGTILEAARRWQSAGSHILGLNLGTVGFLAAASDARQFMAIVKQVIAGDYQVVERMMIEATVKRAGKQLLKVTALNDVVVTSPLSIVELHVQIDGHPYQYIRGSGVIVATPTGSTAYNLSAHGPIVMPDIKSLILTEILDHNVPTPSLVVEPSRQIEITIHDFRAQGMLRAAGKPADVIITADGSSIFPLEPKDQITIRRSAKSSPLVQINRNHFFTSLQDKFTLK